MVLDPLGGRLPATHIVFVGLASNPADMLTGSGVERELEDGSIPSHAASVETRRSVAVIAIILFMVSSLMCARILCRSTTHACAKCCTLSRTRG